jgi:hypothetical protein
MRNPSAPAVDGIAVAKMYTQHLELRQEQFIFAPTIKYYRFF